ncbi:MAG: hypothetical protein IJU64_00150 [Bacilli bacterium]|nr:hypothetical protein [Bacilli bacterium]
MKRTRLALLSFTAMLCLSCASGESSSSSSSASSEEPVYSSRKVAMTGNGTFSTVVGEMEQEVKGSFKDFRVNLSISEFPSTLLDLFTPAWYEGLSACGDLYFSTLVAETKINGIDAVITIPTTTLPYALSKGDLYLDFTSITLPDLSAVGIHDPSHKKIIVEKPFADVNKNAPEFDLPLEDLPSMLMGAVDVEKLDPYLDVKRHDKETFLIQYQISTPSIKALVEQFGMGDQIDVSVIDTYLPGLEGSTLDLYYNLRKSTFSGIGLDLGFDLKLATLFPEVKQLADLKPIHIHLSIAADQQMIESVLMPSLEGYEPFTLYDEAA